MKKQMQKKNPKQYIPKAPQPKSQHRTVSRPVLFHRKVGDRRS